MPGRRLPAGAKERMLLATQRLAAEYPQAECALRHRNPLQLLVATILSAQCTDERVNMVTPALFARYPSAGAFAAADPAELEAMIRSTGFFRSKAAAIIAAACDIVARFGGKVPGTMEELVSLRGVGRKTANVVLGVGFGIPGFPVDTHVTRLSRRLRLTAGANPVEIEADICSVVPASEWTDFSLRLILHGRRICVARTPRCPQCVLSDFCPSSSVAGAAPKAQGRGRGPGARGSARVTGARSGRSSRM